MIDTTKPHEPDEDACAPDCQGGPHPKPSAPPLEWQSEPRPPAPGQLVLLPLPHPSHRLRWRDIACARCGMSSAAAEIVNQCAAAPVLKPCTVETTPEEWAVAHKEVCGDEHEVEVSSWGAICRKCSAPWSRDPLLGGPDRRRAGPKS